MGPNIFARPPKLTLEERVIGSLEEMLAQEHYVSAIGILTRTRLLEQVHVEAWRKGRIGSLQEALQVGPNKLNRVWQLLAAFVKEKRLIPTEVSHTRITREGPVALRFTAEGDEESERVFHIHYVSPDLPPKQQEKLKARASKAEEPAVFEIVRDSACSECGVELPSGSFLWMEAQQPLCLACAGRDDLEYLPAGDTALTRRATKYSARHNVVVRFSRSRGRYERQGILVEKDALEKAERECAEDATERAAARARAAVERLEEDLVLVERMTAEILALFPGCPPAEARKIAAHTAERGSGRVGRSAAGRKLSQEALTLAVGAAIRHNHTRYDEMLSHGVDRDIAREKVGGQVLELLAQWRR